jgi:Uma2 family endonuclease
MDSTSSPQTVSDYERERGKPMPSKAHGYTQANLIGALLSYRDRFTIFSELTLALDEREVTPDLSLYAAADVDLLHDDVRVQEPPLLAVEIQSPTQSLQALIDKIEFLLGAGVQSCWLVQPPLRTVTVFPGALNGTTVSNGTVVDPVLDIEIGAAAVFDQGRAGKPQS